MHTYEVRNKRTKMVLGEVRVEHPEDALNEWMRESGMTLEDIYNALGGSMDAVRASLDFEPVTPRETEPDKHAATRPLSKAMPVRRHLFREAC